MYRSQHKRRLSWMPWLYFRLKPEHAAWARAWQAEVHAELMSLETVEIDPEAFVAPEAQIFAEPGRTVRLGARAAVAADVFLHGPIELGPDVSVNHRVTMDGGAAGIHIGAGCRIATGATLFAFDHGTAPDRPVRSQPVRSRGIRLGRDVWVGAQAGITDGVEIGDGAVIAMGAIVTEDVEPGTVVAGVPARPVRPR